MHPFHHDNCGPDITFSENKNCPKSPGGSTNKSRLNGGLTAKDLPQFSLLIQFRF